MSQLEYPVALAFAPGDRIFFSEFETGRIRIIVHGELLAEPFYTFLGTWSEKTTANKVLWDWPFIRTSKSVRGSMLSTHASMSPMGQPTIAGIRQGCEGRSYFEGSATYLGSQGGPDGAIWFTTRDTIYHLDQSTLIWLVIGGSLVLLAVDWYAIFRKTNLGRAIPRSVSERRGTVEGDQPYNERIG